ncbi:SsgA family sporulation/cell division regulator [Kitasatospora sp. NPDC005748]|uniref:SsgA family sporulation/cell division regulator n=1 Tax=unclassified Kitasatospora TaxID=2633591 RepID=UPI0033C7CA30
MDVFPTRTTMCLQTDPDTLVSVAVELSYSSDDPYAVHCFFPDEPVPVSWTFGRDLLAAGLERVCGEGDVRIEPADRQHTWIAISDGDSRGVALLLARTRDLADFLARTYRAVPGGTESRHIDWDACIGHLLNRESGQDSRAA